MDQYQTVTQWPMTTDPDQIIYIPKSEPATTDCSDKHVLGWIILSFVLAAALITFIILWVFAVNDQYHTPNNTCFGSFGIETGVDANPINQCGTSQSDPCIFALNSIADSEAQCNTLSSICNAFTFNSSTSTMKIVQPTNTFISAPSNLFVRQSGMIS